MKAVNPEDPEGPLVDITIAKGKWWTHHCTSCGWDNGMFIETDTRTRSMQEKDRGCPINKPCHRCRKSPVIWRRIYNPPS